MESRAASAGAFVAMLAGRFALRNHHAPPAIRNSSAASAAASGASPNRLFCGVGARVHGVAGFALLRWSADLKRIDVDRPVMFLSWVAPRSLTLRSSRCFTCR